MNVYIQRLLGEPLLHFFLAGGLIFLVYSSAQDDRESEPGVIVISAEQRERLSLQFQSVWSSEPSVAELDKVIDSYIREEVYYREALALGLDKNDTVVRQRMRQKIEFLTDVGAQLLNATEQELQTYLAENQDQYDHGSRRAFEQYYLGQAATKAEVDNALQSLRSQRQPDLNPPSRLPREVSLMTAPDIDSIFGHAFTAQIAGYSLNQWSGPVT